MVQWLQPLVDLCKVAMHLAAALVVLAAVQLSCDMRFVHSMQLDCGAVLRD